jgi:anti-anti-sigma regulatory factor
MSTQPISVPASPAASATLWRIEGQLIISTVSDWHRQLVGRLASVPALALDLGGVTAFDVFGLQLLLAARRSALAQGRTLTLAAVPPLFDEACASAGMVRSAFSTPASSL